MATYCVLIVTYSYISNGLIGILDRNIATKSAPEKWQMELAKQYDIIITFEERVFTNVVDGM